jgi:hypothetical protein
VTFKRWSVLLLSLLFLLPAVASAHSIDYLATSISPAASFNGSSGNFTYNESVAPGAALNFTLTFGIVSQGSTTVFPRTVTFGASPNLLAAPIDAVVFANASTSVSRNVTLIAPSTPGAYSVKIAPVSGTGGRDGLSGGGGVAVNFTVSEPVPTCNLAATSVAVNAGCIVFHTGSTQVSATLTSGGSPLAGRTIDFNLDGSSAGSAVTDANGVATLSLSTGSLAVGDHTVSAAYAGDGCDYDASSGSDTLGVTYAFIGYQQPINADGSSIFGGRAIPVKIRIADANGAPVPDAEAHLFFAFGMPTVVGTDAEPLANTNSDSGNRMRYDASADQYIFNWDTNGLANGTYTIRVDLGEGSCGDPHIVTLSIRKKGK